MTINSTLRKIGPFAGNGVQTVFPFPFKVFAAADMYVVQLDNLGVETVLVLTNNYTVALNADQNASPGGTLNMVVAPPVGYTLTIGSAVSETQGQSIPNNGGFFPKVIEDALDRLTIEVQQITEGLTRAIQFAFSDTTTNGKLPTQQQRANNLLGFDQYGNMVAVAPAAQSATALQTLLATVLGAGLIGTLGSPYWSTVQGFITWAGAILTTLATTLTTLFANFQQVAIAGGPTAASGGAGVLTGAYEYAVSYVTVNGETAIGGTSNNLTVAANSIQLTGIPTSADPTVIKRRIYRTKASPVDVVIKYLVVEIADNTTTVYLDNVADGSLGVAAPRTNTTGSLLKKNGVRFAATDGDTTIFGLNACPSNTGYSNTFYGSNSGAGVLNAYRSTGIGNYALYSLTVGFEDTAVGVHALHYLTTGQANTGIGYSAGMNITTGNGNVFVGDFAGLSNATSTSNNTIIGYSALQQNVQTLGNNTIIGMQAGFSNITGHDNIFIGKQAGYRSTASNTLIIDNQDRTTEALEQSYSMVYALFGANAGSQVFKVGAKFRSANSSVFLAIPPSSTQVGSEMNENGDWATSSGASTAARNTHTFYNGNGLVGVIQTNGAATNFTSLSDRRAKKNIRKATSAAAMVMRLFVRQFDWKKSGAHVTHGLIAQEAHGVFPDAAIVGDRKNPWMVDNSKLVPLLIKHCQELEARLAALEAKG